MSRLSCVADTNIWIDLHNAGILSAVFNLQLVWKITDFVQDELVTPEGEYLVSEGVGILELAPVQVGELVTLNQQYPQISISDLSSFICARDYDMILLTGDNSLRKHAESQHVSVHGMLWVLDRLVDEEILIPIRAADSLEKILTTGGRLPKKECQERIHRWRADSR